MNSEALWEVRVGSRGKAPPLVLLPLTSDTNVICTLWSWPLLIFCKMPQLQATFRQTAVTDLHIGH